MGKKLTALGFFALCALLFFMFVAIIIRAVWGISNYIVFNILEWGIDLAMVCTGLAYAIKLFEENHFEDLLAGGLIGLLGLITIINLIGYFPFYNRIIIIILYFLFFLIMGIKARRAQPILVLSLWGMAVLLTLYLVFEFKIRALLPYGIIQYVINEILYFGLHILGFGLCFLECIGEREGE